jgi:hypothetical protein
MMHNKCELISYLTEIALKGKLSFIGNAVSISTVLVNLYSKRI